MNRTIFYNGIRDLLARASSFNCPGIRFFLHHFLQVFLASLVSSAAYRALHEHSLYIRIRQ